MHRRSLLGTLAALLVSAKTKILGARPQIENPSEPSYEVVECTDIFELFAAARAYVDTHRTPVLSADIPPTRGPAALGWLADSSVPGEPGRHWIIRTRNLKASLDKNPDRRESVMNAIRAPRGRACLATSLSAGTSSLRGRAV